MIGNKLISIFCDFGADSIGREEVESKSELFIIERRHPSRRRIQHFLIFDLVQIYVSDWKYYRLISISCDFGADWSSGSRDIDMDTILHARH